MSQLSLLVGIRKRDGALLCLEEARAGLLSKARAIAVQVCLSEGYVTIDDVRAQMLWLRAGQQNGNAWMGSIFRDKRFEPCGRQKSRLVTNHGRQVTVYRLRGKRE